MQGLDNCSEQPQVLETTCMDSAVHVAWDHTHKLVSAPVRQASNIPVTSGSFTSSPARQGLPMAQHYAQRVAWRQKDC